MFNFAQREEELVKNWEEKKIFEKSLELRRTAQPFIFYEGPPTANGKPGIHHVLARAFKDVILRYKTMQGFYVERKAGWDTHGLPVEIEVEKKLNISGKQGIEAYGVGAFNSECRTSVWQYQKEWEELTKRIGFWLDLKHPYVTYSNEYIESVWWIFKQLHEKNLLYRGHRVVPQCPRCATALSSHEVAQGYKAVTENSITVKFPVKGETNTFILSWTTTPWTLPGNVALAVAKDVEYWLCEQNGEKYYVAGPLASRVLGDSFIVLKKITGADLVGKEYTPLFEGAVDSGGAKAWYVAAADFVTVTDGTGVVHTAVMYGEDDYSLGEQLGLPKVHTVDEQGRFLSSVQAFAGRFVKDKDVEEEIIQDLKTRGLLYREEAYQHDYPFCWRCQSPLLYYAKDSWFIRMTDVKERLLANNGTINWIPAHIKEGRFGEWLAGVRDWAVSRERYWGTPLPLWICSSVSCGALRVIGSLAELQEASNYKKIFGGKELDLHRPFIDAVNFFCVVCGSNMERVKEVVDCWFDSGAMPFAQHHYPFEHPEQIDTQKAFPADYISEAVDQTRGWFYTLLAIATALGFESPYKNVICLGHILDAKGQKMSKSRGNTVDPWSVLNEVGADTLRYFFYTINQPGESKNFDMKSVREVMRSVFGTLANVVSFYQLYANKKHEYAKPNEPGYLDWWILSRLANTCTAMTAHFNAYRVSEAVRHVGIFINDLSTWYVRRSRERIKLGGEEGEYALWTLHAVLEILAKLLAPSAPFISEDVYASVMLDSRRKESVHLEDWPVMPKEFRNDEIEEEMSVVRALVERGLALRATAKIKVRQPLRMIKVGARLSKPAQGLLIDELNVLEYEQAESLNEHEGWLISEGAPFFSLKVELDDELQIEGLYRELVRNLNAKRKEKGLTIHNPITLYWITVNKELQDLIQARSEQLKREVLVGEIIAEEQKNMEELSINGRLLRVTLNPKP